MPTVSEPTGPSIEDKRLAALNDYRAGVDTLPVLKARLYATGLRGVDISLYIKEAQWALLDAQPKKPEPSNVLMLELGGKATTFRFNNYANAAYACRMLRRVPGVIFANVVSADAQHIVIDVNRETFVSNMLRLL